MSSKKLKISQIQLLISGFINSYMKKILFVALILNLSSCSNNSSINEQNAHKINTYTIKNYPVKPFIVYKDDGDENGDGDIGLSIVSISETDSATIYKAVSSWQNRNLGLSVSIPKKDGEKDSGGEIALNSIGVESDYLLRTIAKIYGQKIDSQDHFTNNVPVRYVNLNDFAKTLGAKEDSVPAQAECKIFFQGKKDDDYAELYLNVDTSAKRLEIKEKDAEYRPRIIKFLKK